MTGKYALCAALLVCAVTSVPLPASYGQVPAAGAVDDGLRLRRIYVPEADIAAEIRDLKPMRREEFDRRLQTLQPTLLPENSPPVATIVSGVYRATLRGDQLTAGIAELEIKRQSTTDPAAADWLRLAPCTVAIGAPVWLNTADPAKPAAAVFGQNEKEQLLLAVPRDGTLQLPWSFRGRRDERGRVKLEFDLPLAARQRLELRLPPGQQLSSDTASLRDLGNSLWQINVAGSRVQLVVAPRQREEQLPLVLVRETGSYVFTPGQLDFDLSLELDIDRAPLRQIRVRYDPRLQWSAIRWGEQALNWVSEKSPTGEPVVVINLPEALTGSSRLIQMTAVADWAPTTQKWTLPRATVEDAIWQEGRTNVAAPRWLQLDALAGPGARLTATTLAADSQALDLLQFQLERSTAVIEVQPAATAIPLDLLSLTTLQVEPKQIVANVGMEITAAGGQHFLLECEIPRQWSLDSLETVPPDLLEDRTLRTKGNNLQVATLHLKQPLRVNRPIRLQARLRHIRGAGAEAWGDDVLQPLRFPAAANSQRFVTLQLGDASFEPRLLNADGLAFLAPSLLPARAKALTDAPIGNWLVQLNDVARQNRFLLAPGSPRYSAETILSVELAPQRKEYRLQLLCEPESSAVSSVLVQFRPVPAVTPQFQFAGEERVLTAERLDVLTADGDQPGLALYRIELPRPRDTRFTLLARWTEALTTAGQAPLVELPEATSQAAELEIAGPLDTPWTWQAERLRPLPIPNDARQLRARYRYQAGQDARLRLSPLQESQRPLAGRIALCDLVSEFSPTGAARHEIRYLVAGADVEALELRLSEHMRLARTVVDGHEVQPYSRSSDPRWIFIPLRTETNRPANHQPLVRLEYTSPPTSTGGWFSSRWTAPLPETRLPTLQSYWQARLPAQWQPWPDSGMQPIVRGSPPDLLGYFAPLVSSSFATTGATTSGTIVQWDLPTGPAAQVQIEVFAPARWKLVAFVIALITAAAALATRNWNPFRLTAVGLLLLTLAWLAPEPYRQFAQAGLAGWLAGCVWQVFQRSLPRRHSDAKLTSTTFSLAPVARLWILISCAAVLSEWLNASAAAQPAPVKPWRVVIPVNAEGRPTDFVYVSPPLWEALLKGGPAGQAAAPDWLLRSAEYELRWNAGSGEVLGELQGLVARYEVDALNEPSTLRLPFLRAQVRLNDPGVRIEGKAAAANWTPDGDALEIELPRAGRQRIELGLALVTPPKDGAVGAQIRVPRVASSRVLVPAIPTGETISIASAQGEENPAIETSWQVELGPAEVLAIQWSRAAADPAAIVEAEQLLLWRLRPSSVVVEGKWMFRPLSGKLREVVLRADPRFRLLPTGNGSSIVRQWSEEGETNLHHFVLDRSVSGDVSLTASFLLAGSTGIGNLNPPRLEPVADRVPRDWQAVWTAPGLQWNGKSSTMPASEFLQAWGDQAVSPVQAFRLAADVARPTLAVTAVHNRLQGEELIEWSLGPEQINGHFRLRGAQASANINQLRFQLPPQFTVRRVFVTQSDVAVANRWFRHADGLLTILLDEVRAEPWQVEITADRPHQIGKAANLPVLQTTEIDVSHYQCLIRRRPGAAVTIGKIPGWNSMPAEMDEEEATAERVLARLDWAAARPGNFPPAIPVTIGATLPGSAGELLTRVIYGEDDWQLEVTAALNSPGSLFDELQFSIPRDWSGPFELEPAGKYSVEALPGQSRNLLRIQLAEPVKDQLRLRIVAPLAAEQELLRLPVVDLIGSHELQRWVSLPRRGGDSPLQWQTAGLQLRTELPESLRHPDAEDDIAYEAIIDRYRASARPERTRQEQPRIVLADHQVSWQADRRIVGRSELTILPGGAKTLVIQPPEAHELVAAIVNDVPTQLRRQPGISGAATIDLHSDSWPQWVEVIYRGRLPVQDDLSGRWTFAAPRVAGVPVEQTRWQVQGPQPLKFVNEGNASPASAVDDVLAPLAALVKVSRGAVDAPVGNHAESARTWLALWRQHWDRELDVIRQRQPSSPVAPIIAARLQTLKNEMADQLTPPLGESGQISPPVAPVSLVKLRGEHSRPEYELRETREGEHFACTVVSPTTGVGFRTSFHWLFAAGLLIFAVAITQADRSAALRDWVTAYPQLVLAGFGVAALLLPGYLWLGGLLLVCTLLATFHSPWKSRA